MNHFPVHLKPTQHYKSEASLVAGKESACDAGDLGLISGLGVSPGEGMATHSNILAWEIPQRSLAGYSPWDFKRVRHND